MKYDDHLEKKIAAIFGIVGTISILLSLLFKGFAPENVFEALANISGLMITLAVFLIAYAISRRNRTFLDVGDSALRKLQKRYDAHLTGPEYDKSNYTPDESLKATRQKYLFWKKPPYSRKVALIPLDPLEQGILEIRVSKSTLLNLGYKSGPTIEQDIERIQAAVSANVQRILQHTVKKAEGNYEYLKLTPSTSGDNMSRYKDSAIVIDLNESNLGFNNFERIVLACGDEAFNTIIKLQEKPTP